MNAWYKDFSEYMQELFPGVKMQKLSIDAGFTCPNRDGTIGTGGCIYCNNASFTPSYCTPADSVSVQLEKGKAFFRRKYPDMKYLAYFQSYTNTFGKTSEELAAMYREALETEDVEGVIIGTRPDCLPDELVNLLADMNGEKKVIVEIGAETSFDRTLQVINRNHTWHDVEDAVRRLSRKGIHTGLHLIAGLPGETSDDVMETIDKACGLPISSIKMHQLQIVKGTPLFRMWQSGEIDVKPYSLESYLELCVEIVKAIGRRVCIERFLSSSPSGMVAAPSWGLKNYQFTHLLHNLLQDSYRDSYRNS